MTDEPLRRQVEALRERCFGKYLGLVADADDPRGQGRLRLLVPSVLGDVLSGWAEPCFSYAGSDPANYPVPPVAHDADGNPTTQVWVEFRGGDPRFPIWVGVPFPRSGD